MAELIPYSYSDHVITPFLFFILTLESSQSVFPVSCTMEFCKVRILLFMTIEYTLFFSSSYLKKAKTASLLLLFFHMKLLFSRKGLLGLFFSPCLHLQKNRMCKNKE